MAASLPTPGSWVPSTTSRPRLDVAGSAITVRVSRDPDAGVVRLEVEDNGPGIPVSERERVLERFRRGPQAAEPGSGLGLAIVHKIIDAHHGTVKVKSKPGLGTTITLILPDAEEEQDHGQT